MQKKILILCDAPGPPLYLPRIVNLCKNLNPQTWEPYIFTEKMLNANFLSDVCPVFQMPYYKSQNKLNWALNWILNFLFQRKDYQLIKFIERQVNITQFDLIFCSSFNLFPLTAGANIAKKYKKPLIVDLRDITEQWGNANYFRIKFSSQYITQKLQTVIEKINIRRRNKVLINADAVSTISPWHKDFLQHINQNTHLIYNGYDASIFNHQKITSKTFEINYMGRIYDLEFRNPSLLFEAVKQLDSEKLITSDSLQINWYIEQSSQEPLNAWIKKYEIQSYNHIYNFVPSHQIPTILNQSSINLILTAKTSENGPRGIMTTKFFEALGVEKPVLCVRSDEGCLAAVINDTNAGIAAKTVDQVKQFIMEKYSEWEHNGYTHQQVVREKKNSFSRQAQAKQFEELFKGLITNKKK